LGDYQVATSAFFPYEAKRREGMAEQRKLIRALNMSSDNVFAISPPPKEPE
jgi:hypothetical protein